jgi:hypothetical protein
MQPARDEGPPEASIAAASTAIPPPDRLQRPVMTPFAPTVGRGAFPGARFAFGEPVAASGRGRPSALM